MYFKLLYLCKLFNKIPMKKIFRRPKTARKYFIWSFIYLCFVIWFGNYWLLFGLLIIADHYIFRKVKWLFWRRWDANHSYIKLRKGSLLEWVDALIFAVVAASIIRALFIEAYTIPTSSMEKTLLVGDYLFVSKFHYGPRLPMTLLSFPFTHHTLPFTKYTKAYWEWIKLPLKRLKGFQKIKNNDIVVFNYPDGDTVILQRQNESYYQVVRSAEMTMQNQLGEAYRKGMGRELIWQQYDVIARPVDKRENYIKRCVVTPGDTLEIKDRQLYINGKPAKNPENLQYQYTIVTDGTPFNPKFLQKMDITEGGMSGAGNYVYPLSAAKAEKISKSKNVKFMSVRNNPAGEYAYYIFPHDSANYRWNEDNFGPLVIPKKGMTIEINTKNILLYDRIIDVYENNDLEIKGDKIYINGKEATTYTFKMDYYWMMGDNRHNSADSRFWGFIPEDHIVGKALFIWLSLDKNKSLFKGKIRWKRIFKAIHGKKL